MSPPVERPGSRRAALARARQSRRPSRLGGPAGVAGEPDYVFAADAGFPGLLLRTWKEAVAAPALARVVETLLTLNGHVPAHIQLRALRPAEECALKALCGVSWRDPDPDRPVPEAAAAQPAFVGEIGLTTTGRVAVRVPGQAALADREDLIDGVRRVPWSAQALSAYHAERDRLERRLTASAADCRQWLSSIGPAGRDRLIEQLKDAALRTAPFILYQDGGRYTNFRERNNLTGKTLWPGHPDCALSSLHGVPLERWSDNDAALVTCLALLVRSAGYARIEEANGTQLSLDHVAFLLEATRCRYNDVPGGRPVAPAPAVRVAALHELAGALGERRKELMRGVQLYREIHGPLLHKIERVASERGRAARGREAALCARLTADLPLAGGTLDELGQSLATTPGFLSRPAGDYRTGLESLVYHTVRAARHAFDADFAMSRGMRSLTRLITALRAQDWAGITRWELPEYFCCVIPAPQARRYFGESPARLADVAWSIAARMQYNSWHFIAGNLPKVPEVLARDYFVPPVIPDIAYYSDQHHHGHVAARVRFSIRSPQPVEIDGRTFAGFVDLRLLRCEDPPFDEQDLLAAHRVSAFIARATTLAAGLVAAGEDVEVAAFDSDWHWATIAGAPPVAGPPEGGDRGAAPRERR